jgi:hypothetical protein
MVFNEPMARWADEKNGISSRMKQTDRIIEVVRLDDFRVPDLGLDQLRENFPQAGIVFDSQ